MGGVWGVVSPHLVLDRLLPLVVCSVRRGVRISLGGGVSNGQLVLIGSHEELTETRDRENFERAVARLHQLREPLHGLEGTLLLDDVEKKVGRATSTEKLTEF